LLHLVGSSIIFYITDQVLVYAGKNLLLGGKKIKPKKALLDDNMSLV